MLAVAPNFTNVGFIVCLIVLGFAVTADRLDK
jgi:hypothetical protein